MVVGLKLDKCKTFSKGEALSGEALCGESLSKVKSGSPGSGPLASEPLLTLNRLHWYYIGIFH